MNRRKRRRGLMERRGMEEEEEDKEEEAEEAICSHLNPWHMCIEGLHTLRMVVSSMPHCTIGSPHCQLPTVKQTTRTIAVLCCLIHNLMGVQ